MGQSLLPPAKTQPIIRSAYRLQGLLVLERKDGDAWIWEGGMQLVLNWGIREGETILQIDS